MAQIIHTRFDTNHAEPIHVLLTRSQIEKNAHLANLFAQFLSAQNDPVVALEKIQATFFALPVTLQARVRQISRPLNPAQGQQQLEELLGRINEGQEQFLDE